MDLSKFVSLLSTRRLYFPNVAGFDDPYEGYVPAQTLEQFTNRFKPEDRPNLAPVLDHLKQWYSLFKSNTFVNCWHMNETESAGMWKLYSTNHKEAIAVRTTFQRASAAFQDLPLEIYAGIVSYSDTVPSFNEGMIVPAMQKRSSFAHERELRFLHVDSDFPHSGFKEGISIPVDLTQLIEQVFVAPLSPSWFKDCVDAILDKFGFPMKAVRSPLYDRPPAW